MSPLGLVVCRWLVVAVMFAAAALWGYTSGVARESDRRDAADLRQHKLDAEERDKALAFGGKKAGEAIALRRRADGYYRSLQERINHVDPTSLAFPECPQPGRPARALAQSGGTAGDIPLGIVVLFGPEFVGLYNAAWAGAGTQIPADPAGAAGAPAGAAPAGPEEILAHTAAEARTCGDDRRRYLKLIEYLEGLR